MWADEPSREPTGELVGAPAGAPAGAPTGPVEPRPSGLSSTLDGGFAVFAATTGALVAFGYSRGGAFEAFAAVGRRIARDITMPGWGDALVGLVVHLGQSLVLGALAALLVSAAHGGARLRSALVVAAVWYAAAMLPWIAVVRADLVLPLGVWPRVGLAVLLVAALVIGPRRAREIPRA